MSDYQAKTKYRSESAAQNYEERRFTEAVLSKEEKMFRELVSRCSAVKTSLDAPCGTGRLTRWLPGEVTALDVSPEMVARVDSSIATCVCGDVENLNFPDNHFDLVACIRLLQHLPDPETLQRVLRELARVSRRYLILSYFEVLSLQHLRRVLKSRFGHSSGRRAHRLSQLKTVLRAEGFSLVARKCSAPGLSEQWFLLFRRRNG